MREMQLYDGTNGLLKMTQIDLNEKKNCTWWRYFNPGTIISRIISYGINGCNMRVFKRLVHITGLAHIVILWVNYINSMVSFSDTYPLCGISLPPQDAKPSFNESYFGKCDCCDTNHNFNNLYGIHSQSEYITSITSDSGKWLPHVARPWLADV